MGRTLEIQEFLRLLPTVPAADVRSPSEYLRAHIPGVMSLPLFSDEERAIIGTLYKHQGRERATLKGMEIAGPKMASYVTQASELAPERRLMVHCWRGGMRSAAMAFTLETAGFEVMLLDGGYRSFRRLALELVQYPWKLRVLGGMTGSGKTQVLKHLQQEGLQVLDLEGMANHKGSAFGSIGQPEQPGTEHFVNRLGLELSRLDPQQTVWVEDESHEIGKVGIPHAFFLGMRAAPLVFMDIPQEQRARHLVAEYAVAPPELLKEAFEKIGKRLGGAALKEALGALDRGDPYTAALLSLQYYDKTYAFGLSARDDNRVRRIDGAGADPRELARRVMETARQHYGD